MELPPRIFINLYEAIGIRKFLACRNLGLHNVPSWMFVLLPVSQFLLVVNSSANMILYIFLDAAFRKHFTELVGKFICCLIEKEQGWRISTTSCTGTSI